MGKVAERANVGSCRKPTFGETGGDDGTVPNVIIWLFAGEMNERWVSGNAIGPLNDRIWVCVTPCYIHSVALTMTSTVSSGMSHIGK